MWPLPKEMVVEATGDTRSVPILWGPTLFYYANLFLQFAMVVGFMVWLAWAYYMQRAEEWDEGLNDRGDRKEESEEQSGHEDKSSNESNVSRRDDSSNTRGTVSKEPMPRRTISDERLLKASTSEERIPHQTASDERIPRRSASVEKAACRTASDQKLARVKAAEAAATDSDSEIEQSEYGETPGMSVRRRRSKRLLEIVGDGTH